MASIAVIGSGRVGGGLARKWAARGHDITFGVRNPGKPELVELAQEIGAATASVDDAVARSEVVVFAIPGGAMAETIKRIGAQLEEKVVIDTANNMRGEQRHSWPAVASASLQAAYYRAFNSYGWEMIDQPVVAGTQADAFYCGPGGATQAIVSS